MTMFFGILHLIMKYNEMIYEIAENWNGKEADPSAKTKQTPGDDDKNERPISWKGSFAASLSYGGLSAGVLFIPGIGQAYAAALSASFFVVASGYFVQFLDLGFGLIALLNGLFRKIIPTRAGPELIMPFSGPDIDNESAYIAYYSRRDNSIKIKPGEMIRRPAWLRHIYFFHESFHQKKIYSDTLVYGLQGTFAAFLLTNLFLYLPCANPTIWQFVTASYSAIAVLFFAGIASVTLVNIVGAIFRKRPGADELYEEAGKTVEAALYLAGSGRFRTARKTISGFYYRFRKIKSRKGKDLTQEEASKFYGIECNIYLGLMRIDTFFISNRIKLASTSFENGRLYRATQYVQEALEVCKQLSVKEMNGYYEAFVEVRAKVSKLRETALGLLDRILLEKEKANEKKYKGKTELDSKKIEYNRTIADINNYLFIKEFETAKDLSEKLQKDAEEFQESLENKSDRKKLKKIINQARSLFEDAKKLQGLESLRRNIFLSEVAEYFALSRQVDYVEEFARKAKSGISRVKSIFTGTKEHDLITQLEGNLQEVLKKNKAVRKVTEYARLKKFVEISITLSKSKFHASALSYARHCEVIWKTIQAISDESETKMASKLMEKIRLILEAGERDTPEEELFLSSMIMAEKEMISGNITSAEAYLNMFKSDVSLIESDKDRYSDEMNKTMGAHTEVLFNEARTVRKGKRFYEIINLILKAEEALLVYDYNAAEKGVIKALGEISSAAEIYTSRDDKQYLEIVLERSEFLNEKIKRMVTNERINEFRSRVSELIRKEDSINDVSEYREIVKPALLKEMGLLYKNSMNASEKNIILDIFSTLKGVLFGNDILWKETIDIEIELMHLTLKDTNYLENYPGFSYLDYAEKLREKEDFERAFSVGCKALDISSEKPAIKRAQIFLYDLLNLWIKSFINKNEYEQAYKLVQELSGIKDFIEQAKEQLLKGDVEKSKQSVM